MAIIQHNTLPSIERLRLEGVAVAAEANCDKSLPLLKIGLLNMMPDKALSATERQLIRLLGANPQCNVEVHLFTIPGIERSEEAQQYINEYYLDFASMQSMQLDAAVISGANVTQAALTDEPFWDDLESVLHWVQANVNSTICSCLATHAACKVFYGLDRKHLGDKCWGVYEHNVVNEKHKLMRGVEPQIAMCHSRFNDISKRNFLQNEAEILIFSESVGVQLAVDEKLNLVFVQGHPEYDAISLLKEYKREVSGFVTQQRDTYPPLPDGYFNTNAQVLLSDYKQQLLASANPVEIFAEFPEEQLLSDIQNPWQSAAQQIFSNWIDLVTNR